MVEGASACSFCPKGTWSGEWAATYCNICPQGKWTHTAGSLQDGQCTPCMGTGCLPDSSASITIETVNLKIEGLGAEELGDLRAAYAKDIASTCQVDVSSVVDLQGNNATVSIAQDGTISAFVLGSSVSANDMATELYSSSFRNLMANSSMAVFADLTPDSVSSMFTGAVNVQPKAFVPLLPTTTLTTSTSTAAPTSASSSSASPTIASPTGASSNASSPVVVDDSQSADRVGQQRESGGGPPWWWFVVGAAVAGVAVAAVVLTMQKKKRRKNVDEYDSAQGSDSDSGSD